MSEQSTYDAKYSAIERINNRIIITDDTQAVDLLLPHHIFNFRTLRLSRIDDRSMVASDLSFVPGDHRETTPPLGIEYDAPFAPIDLIEDEPIILGRDPQFNPDNLGILADVRVSRQHLKITPSLGEKGLLLAILDSESMNGSRLLVHAMSPNALAH